MVVGKMSKLFMIGLLVLCLTAVLTSADDDESWWSKFKSQAKKFGEKAKDGFEDMGKDVKPFFKNAGEKLSDFGKTVSTQAQKGYEKAKDGTVGAFDKVKEVVQGVGEYFGFQKMNPALPFKEPLEKISKTNFKTLAIDLEP